ncbi:hypothetical protein [Roseicyclus persicicus]|uniref:Uncharacterized protein n=1 Tax=Roseicyclus persicicus TaxID=2650661 RepID=A0A7X6GXA0_9RHOB|nr:hypothetical protein [Roseibacterium persicicum]NKX43354.1 hypothetical protein [Roseibacterium persicicum]
MDNDSPIRFLTPPDRPVPSAPAGDALDPVALAVLVAIGLGLLFWAGLARRAARRLAAPARARRSCRWYLDRRRHGVPMARFTCAACGVEAYSQDGLPPKECKRAWRPASL